MSAWVAGLGEEKIVVPLHIVGEHEIVDPAGTTRPKFFGRLGGTVGGLVCSAEPRSCKSS